MLRSERIRHPRGLFAFFCATACGVLLGGRAVINVTNGSIVGFGSNSTYDGLQVSLQEASE
jgi:hypothetical protein